MNLRQRITVALTKPLPPSSDELYSDYFSPWDDIIQGFSGSYNSECDRLMICALQALKCRSTSAFIDREGLPGEFVLYLLDGHRVLECGTSPRCSWFDDDIADLADPLISKWRAYAVAVWGGEFSASGL